MTNNHLRVVCICLLATVALLISTATALSFVYPTPTPTQLRTIDNLWNTVYVFSSFAIGWMVGRAAKG